MNGPIFFGIACVAGCLWRVATLSARRARRADARLAVPVREMRKTRDGYLVMVCTVLNCTADIGSLTKRWVGRGWEAAGIKPDPTSENAVRVSFQKKVK